jgi:sigma-B regulation protein RsbU (phosphoserine phosphatase)
VTALPTAAPGASGPTTGFGPAFVSPAQAGRLLVVDDNEMNRDLLSRRLQRMGHVVHIARNGREALEAMDGVAYDVVLLDIMMPEVNGYEVLARMRASSALRHIPVIMISAVEEVESVVRCIELGADDYLTKPFDPVLLRARLGSCLEKKRLRDAERTHARSLERELDIGREIQAGFFPDVMPEVAGWSVAARFRAARQVGGDFYDAFTLGSDGRRIALVLADVCGKGVGAALFMALFRTLVRATLLEVHALGQPDGEVVRRAVGITNDYIASTHGRANMFATMLVGVVDLAEGSMTYVNAGHEPPAIAGGGAIRARLEPTGPAVGMLPDIPFEVAYASLAPGDVLLAFTDGVTEARATDGAFYGEDRLLAELATARDAGTLLARVEEDLRQFVGDAEQSDDVTMLALGRASIT